MSPDHTNMGFTTHPCMLTSQAEFLLPRSNLVEGRIKTVKEETLRHIYKLWGLPLDTHKSLLVPYLYILRFILKWSLRILLNSK